MHTRPLAIAFALLWRRIAGLLRKQRKRLQMDNVCLFRFTLSIRPADHVYNYSDSTVIAMTTGAVLSGPLTRSMYLIVSDRLG